MCFLENSDLNQQKVKAKGNASNNITDCLIVLIITYEKHFDKNVPIEPRTLLYYNSV